MDLTKLSERELQARIDHVQHALDAAGVILEQYHSEINRLYDTRRAMLDELDTRIIRASKHNAWPVLLEETGTSSNARYHAANGLLKSLMPPDITCALFSGYRSSIQQRSLTIFVNEEPGVVEAAEHVISTLLPHMKWLHDIDDVQPHHHIEIMDDTCSENGSLWLLIDQPNGLYQLWISRYSHKRLTTCKSLRELLQYVAKHYPYRGCKSC